MSQEFGIMNFVVGTAILWGVTYLLVIPITRLISKKKSFAIDALPTRLFITVHIIVLGLIGLIFGLGGYDIIGIAKQKKMWPGLIVMALASIMGAVFREGRIFGHSF